MRTEAERHLEVVCRTCGTAGHVARNCYLGPEPVEYPRSQLVWSGLAALELADLTHEILPGSRVIPERGHRDDAWCSVRILVGDPEDGTERTVSKVMWPSDRTKSEEWLSMTADQLARSVLTASATGKWAFGGKGSTNSLRVSHGLEPKGKWKPPASGPSISSEGSLDLSALELPDDGSDHVEGPPEDSADEVLP